MAGPPSNTVKSVRTGIKQQQKERLLSIWNNDQRVKKSGTTFSTWIIIYKDFKWKSLYPVKVAPFSASGGCFDNFK